MSKNKYSSFMVNLRESLQTSVLRGKVLPAMPTFEYGSVNIISGTEPVLISVSTTKQPPRAVWCLARSLIESHGLSIGIVSSFHGFSYQNCKFIAHKPVIYTVVHRAEENDYVVECEDLGLFFPCESRSEILPGLQEQISLLWEIYALEDDSNLTEDAIELKHKLLDTFKPADEEFLPEASFSSENIYEWTA